MGIRETLNEHRGATTAATVAVVGIALAAIVYQLWPQGNGGGGGDAYFTTDNGDTWFEGEADKEAPFMKDGKEAVRAYVYKCPGNKEFVGYMERLTAEGRKAYDAARADPSMAAPIMLHQREVKRPADTSWVTLDNIRMAGPVTIVTCPDKSVAKPILP